MHAGPRRFAGRAELTGRVHGVEREREKGRTGQRLSAWQRGPVRQRGKRGVEGETTGADRSALAGRERASERERGGEKAAADRWIPPVRRRGREAWLGRARPSWAAGLIFLFLFLWIF